MSKGYYGPMLDRLSEREWHALLSSNTGLFRRGPPHPNAIGPRLQSDGEVTGDIELIERVHFEQHAQDNQKRLLAVLEKENEQAYHEYLLTITQTIDIWRNDARMLQRLLRYLKKKEHDIETRKEDIDRSRILDPHELDGIVRRHFQPFVQRLSQEDTDMHQRIIAVFNEKEKKIRGLEQYLERYLERLRQKMPFLFTN